MKTALLTMMGTAIFVSGVAGQPNPQAVPRAPQVLKVAASGGSYLGVMVQEIDSDRAKVLKLHEEAGVEITHVESESPADKAGLKNGDVILQYNGQRVEGMEQFSRLVRETPPGRDAKLDVIRGGAPQTVMVKVGVKRASAPFLMGPVPSAAPPGRFELRMPDIPRSFMTWRSSALGIECEGLEGQLAQYFGVQEGVLVRAVVKGSAAEKSGIKAGDVITRVDDSKVATPADVSSHIRSLRGKTVPVVLMRDHKETTVTVTVDDEDRSEWFWQQNMTPLVPGRVQ
jgi:serine protease Do